MTLLGLKQTMSISENNQKSFNVPPCKYEDVVLYYQEKANLYCEPFQEIFMGKNFMMRKIFKGRFGSFIVGDPGF